jgi:hypothetical protein
VNGSPPAFRETKMTAAPRSILLVGFWHNQEALVESVESKYWTSRNVRWKPRCSVTAAVAKHPTGERVVSRFVS